MCKQKTEKTNEKVTDDGRKVGNEGMKEWTNERKMKYTKEKNKKRMKRKKMIRNERRW